MRGSDAAEERAIGLLTQQPKLMLRARGADGAGEQEEGADGDPRRPREIRCCDERKADEAEDEEGRRRPERTRNSGGGGTGGSERSHASNVGPPCSGKSQDRRVRPQDSLKPSILSGVDEPVAGAGLREEVAGPRGIGLELAAQLRDVDVEVV